jgi:hypothetical protein
MLMAKGNSPRPAPPPGEFGGRIRTWVTGWLLLLSLIVFVSRSLFTTGTLLGQGQVREGKKSVQRERRGDCFGGYKLDSNTGAFTQSNHPHANLRHLLKQPFELGQIASPSLTLNLALSRTRMLEPMLASAPVSLSTMRLRTTVACAPDAQLETEASSMRMSLPTTFMQRRGLTSWTTLAKFGTSC